MSLDTHVHTVFSGYSTIKPLRKVMRESYNSVEGVYRRARARGMDLVVITDHDTIDGAPTIAHRPDVIVGCEVSGVFPNDGVRVHLGVIGVTETQHREIQRLRHNVVELLPYLNSHYTADELRQAMRDPHVRPVLVCRMGVDPAFAPDAPRRAEARAAERQAWPRVADELFRVYDHAREAITMETDR